VIVFVSGKKTVIVFVFVQDPSPAFRMTKKVRLAVEFGKREARASLTDIRTRITITNTVISEYDQNRSKHEAQNTAL
jgi:hypothetical protein